MKVGVLSEFIPSKKNKPKCLLAATAFEKVYTSFFFYSHSAKSAFLITTTKNHLTGSLEKLSVKFPITEDASNFLLVS